MEEEVITYRERQVEVGEGGVKERLERQEQKSKAEPEQRMIPYAPIRKLKDGRLAAIDRSILPGRPIIFDGLTENEAQIVARLQYQQRHPEDYFAHFPNERRIQEDEIEEELQIQSGTVEEVLKPRIKETRSVEFDSVDTRERRYLPGFEFVENVSSGRRCSVDRVVNDSGLEIAFKGLVERTPPNLHRLKSEARMITALANEGSQYTPKFAILAIGDDNPGTYVEYVPDKLETLIDEGLEPHAAVELLAKIADPVRRLHEKGKAELDLKPKNYRARENGDPVLVDLEWGRRSVIEEFSRTIQVSGEADNAAIVSLSHMAPEQKIKPRPGEEHLADIYSLGAIFYEVLTGRYPDGIPESLTESPRIVEALGREKTEELNAFVFRTMAQEPRKRPQSVDELVSGVKEIVGYRNAEEIEFEQREKDRQEVEGLRTELVRTKSILASAPVQTLEEKAEDVEVGVGDVARESLSKVGEIGRILGKAMLKGAYGLSLLSGCFTAIPTMARKAYNYGEAYHTPDGYSSLLIGGVVTNTLAYVSLMENALEAETVFSNPELAGKIFLAQLAANALSGAYEIVRYGYKKAKAKKEEFVRERFPQILEQVKKGDLSFLVRDDKLRTEGETLEEGMNELRRMFGGYSADPYGRSRISKTKLIKEMIKRGLAYDGNSAERLIGSLPNRNGVYLGGRSDLWFETIIDCQDSNGREGYILIPECGTNIQREQVFRRKSE